LSRRKLLVVITYALSIACGITWFVAHRHHSPEFLELHTQEIALQLPSGRRDISDYGCHRPLFLDNDEIQCHRNITRVYTDTSLKSFIEDNLVKNQWAHHDTDKAMSLSGPSFDKNAPIHIASWDLYTKSSSQGMLCAVVSLEYNFNYKKSAPWAVTLDLFGKTENCQSHL
jgi:hypothetical protein